MEFSSTNLSDLYFEPMYFFGIHNIFQQKYLQFNMTLLVYFQHAALLWKRPKWDWTSQVFLKWHPKTGLLHVHMWSQNGRTWTGVLKRSILCTHTHTYINKNKISFMSRGPVSLQTLAGSQTSPAATQFCTCHLFRTIANTETGTPTPWCCTYKRIETKTDARNPGEG